MLFSKEYTPKILNLKKIRVNKRYVIDFEPIHFVVCIFKGGSIRLIKNNKAYVAESDAFILEPEESAHVVFEASSEDDWLYIIDLQLIDSEHEEKRLVNAYDIYGVDFTPFVGGFEFTVHFLHRLHSTSLE